MKRNRRGYLTVEDLKAGMIEQSAMLHADETRTIIELFWISDIRGGAFYVKHRHVGPSGRDMGWREQPFTNIDEARKRFADLTRHYPRITE